MKYSFEEDMKNTENFNPLSETNEKELVRTLINLEPNTAIGKRQLERYKEEE